jgi:hypothetical protein
MPQLSRRRFLQVASAAGLVPALPAFPASVTAATTRGLTASQMLWASLQARAGSAQNLGRMTQSMGISGEAAKGVYTKLIQNHAVTAHGAASLSRVARPAPMAAPAGLSTAPTAKVAQTQPIKVDLKRLLSEDVEDHSDQIEGEETEELDP